MYASYLVKALGERVVWSAAGIEAENGYFEHEGNFCANS